MNSVLSKYPSLSRFGAAICSGVLLWLSWPPQEIPYLIFFAWVPLLWLSTTVVFTRNFLWYTLITMLIWNTSTTWWIWNSTIPGAIGAILFNSVLMALPWIGFHLLYKKQYKTIAYIALIAYWICFEYIHLNWDLSWPWLSLGNVFAADPTFVQWYEYTGTSGGTLWILLVNILLWQIWEFKKQYNAKLPNKQIIAYLLAIITPITISILITQQRQNLIHVDTQNKNVVIVQPNIDPYNEKFTNGTQQAQIQKLIDLSLTQIDSNTTLLIWPETAVLTQVFEDEIKVNSYYQPIFKFIRNHPNITLITGIDSYKKYTSQDKTPSSARKDASGIYYDGFNTALCIDTSFRLPIYHKSKLVPGVEMLPSWLNFLGKWFEDFGGISGTLGTQSERSVFIDVQHHYIAAPIICYESIYGEYVTEYIRKGANILTIMTNDGWWGNTQGYRQHMLYAKLRAIETRCWVARSANTGISCFIDPLGNIINPQPWNTAIAIKNNISIPNNTQTFYVRYKDILSRLATAITILILIWLSWLRIKNIRLKKI